MAHSFFLRQGEGKGLCRKNGEGDVVGDFSFFAKVVTFFVSKE